MQNNVLILDFGSQYTQLIARRVRELNVYCEIHPFNKIPKNLNYFKALILSGSPYSVREPNIKVGKVGSTSYNFTSGFYLRKDLYVAN